MQVIIDINDEIYKEILNGKDGWSNYVHGLIRTGTPLPKGHGRLGDLDVLEQEMINGIKAGNYEDGYDDYSHINNMDDCIECVRYADTIIEGTEE